MSKAEKGRAPETGGLTLAFSEGKMPQSRRAVKPSPDKGKRSGLHKN